MRIQFWSIGKNHEAYVNPGITEFTKRINNYFPASWNIIPVPKNAASLNETDQKRKEADSIISFINSKDYLVALDEKGRSFSSPQLATFLQQRANDSSRQLIFLIGGAYGLDVSVLQRADLKMSLSTLTFPHQLVRLILAEQVYRACTILKNEQYHHS